MNQPDIYHWNRSQTNVLLNKDDLGRSKRSTYRLPADQHAYGKSFNTDAEGAKEVTLTWMQHVNTADIRPERDFRKLNKMAIRNKLHRSDQYQEFRKYNDARVRMVKGQHQIQMELPDENFRYGRPNQPSTPVKHLIGNMFGNNANQSQTEKYMRLTSGKSYNAQATTNQFQQTKHTNTSILRESVVKAQLDERTKNHEEPFKLSKFKTVAAKTNSFRQRPSSANPAINKQDNYSEQYRIPSEAPR